MTLTHIMVIGNNGCWAKVEIVGNDEGKATKEARRLASQPKSYNVYRCDAEAYVTEGGSMMHHERQLVKKV
jgi:hypothetical protein